MWVSKEVEWIDIELTSYCNIDCPGCFRQVKRDKVDHILNKNALTFYFLKDSITFDVFPNLKLLNFCGSIDEPTTHPEILDIVRYFNSKGININISSNGSTRTEKFWHNLGKEGISVFFGIDGIDQESLEKYRIGSNFKKIQKNFRSFINAGGHALWQFIAFEHNEHLIDDAKKMAKEEGFDNFRLIYSHRNENNESKKVQRKQEQEVVCKYLNQKRIFISHTGSLLPCCFFNSEFLQDYAGNETDSDFVNLRNNLGGDLADSLHINYADEIIEGDLFSEVVKSWSNKPLTRCWNTCKKAKQDVFIQEKL
tara:strand:+ start:243 stop:1172 length:930 start_codon:yes stop_codon:yes gene_type:complete